MSINKNAYLRYQVLDKCFSNQYKMYFFEDLLEEVNKTLEEFNGDESKIGRRQLFDDFRFMESEAGWSIPLERLKLGKKVYYRYSDKSFSIKNQKISDAEIDAINSALMVLLRFKGMPQFEWLNELAPKLKSTFRNDNTPEVICFDQNEFLSGLDLLPQLYQHIINKNSLEIIYHSFKEKNPKKYTVHPYYLKQYNKRWFLFGLNADDNLLYNLPLDRIKSIAISKLKYIDNKIYDFQEYFEDIVGVSRNNDSTLVKLLIKVDSDLAPYIKTKPLHGSQKKLKEDKTSVTFEFELILNIELKQLLLSYGPGIEILAPAEFREEIKQLIQQMASKYN